MLQPDIADAFGSKQLQPLQARMPVLADDDVVRGGQLDAKEYTEEPNSARLAFFALSIRHRQGGPRSCGRNQQKAAPQGSVCGSAAPRSPRASVQLRGRPV